MSDPYDLGRFLNAQDDGSYDRALSELRAGHKSSHWMWFVFPQVAGLGHSAMAVRYAISGLDEARAYLSHAVLGSRYATCCAAVLDLGDVSVSDVLGAIDAQKLHSSLTLFAEAAPAGRHDRRPAGAALQRPARPRDPAAALTRQNRSEALTIVS